MTSGHRLLLVEDDVVTQAFVADGLSREGWMVDTAGDGEDGFKLATQNAYGVLIVDRLLPKLDGLAMVRALRGGSVETPAIFLTALGSIADRVEGLDCGGDDYLVKPFSLVELNARVGALARRGSRGAAKATLEVDGVTLDRIARIVRREGRIIDLLRWSTGCWSS